MTNEEYAAHKRVISAQRIAAGLCPRDGQPAAPGKRRCQKCCDRHKTTKTLRKADKDWLIKQPLPTEYDCTRCNKRKPASHFGRHRNRKRNTSHCRRCRKELAYAAGICTKCVKHTRDSDSVFCGRCRIKSRQKSADERARLKADVLAHYSKTPTPSCACCGESRYEFLSIDHIDGSGAKHRKTIGKRVIWAWLRRHNYPPGFQVLCMNCNWAKGKLGYCPHERERAAGAPRLPV